MAEKYILKRSNRRTLSLKVEKYTGRVIVSAPKSMPLSVINSWVEEKSNWIKRCVQKVELQNQILPPLNDGEKIYIAGNYYLIKISSLQRAGLKDGVIILPSVGRKKALASIAKKLFLPYILQKTQDLANKHGFKFSSVKVGSAKSKWGSCSAKNELIYSVGLAFLPEEYCDFVVAHELCHTVVKNHGKSFYSLLLRVMPNYLKWDKSLKNYSSFLCFLQDKSDS